MPRPPRANDRIRGWIEANLAENTIQAVPTALVHEAYLKLVGDRGFNDRQNLFRVAAEAMRQILIDRARRRQRIRKGGNRERVTLSEVASLADSPADELLALDETPTRFAELEPQKAELVKLRYFAGLSEHAAAEALGISRATANLTTIVTARARPGGRVEWHVVLRKSFEHLTFEHVPWLHHSIVFLLPPLSLPWFETIRSVADSMGIPPATGNLISVVRIISSATLECERHVVD